MHPAPAHSPPDPTTVVFDLGGVVLAWNPEHLYARLIPDPVERRWFLTEICTRAWNDEQDRGRSVAEGTAVLLARFPDQADRIRAYYDRWAEMVPGLVPGTEDLIRRLRDQGRPVYALSNFGAEMFALAEARWPVLRAFDGLTLSSRVGLLKPDPAIYHRFLADHGRVAADCLFIDDVAVNVEAARAVGMQAVQFTGAEALCQDLRARGLI
jgi:2-haloacid dehalogenase